MRNHAILLVTLAATLTAQPELFTKQHCAACHSPTAKVGGFVLEGTPESRPEIWEKALKRVRAGEMPPARMPRPSSPAVKQFLNTVTAELDKAAPFAGRPAIRRLNRTEYANAVRDLFQIELPLAAELPPDQIAAGFDNIADALSMSPLLLERYLKVARRVSEYATGTADPSPVVEIFPVTKSQSVWQGEGMPFGTRGGILVNHYFPHNGDYDLRAFLAKESLTPTEGVRFFRTRLTNVKAGNHTVIVTFPNEYAEREGPVLNVGGPGGEALGGPLDVLGTAVRPTIEFRLDGHRVKLFEISGMTSGEAAFDGQPGPPTLGRIEIAGPHNAKPDPRYTCPPTTNEPSCAKQILTPIVRRAFRRDVTPTDLAPFLKSFTKTREKRDFPTAIAAALRDILLTPDFLFRLEFDSPTQSLTGFELATRLSFFLWSTIPDEDLLNAAPKLHSPEVLEREVRRMLADSRATSLMDNFASQWLGLRALQSVEPDKQLFPEFDSALAAAFQNETRLFVNSVIRENRAALDLLRADYTYLDERLAQHYGIPGVTGAGFRRVPLTNNATRGGLLSHGSVLLLTSHSTRTAPVLRGKWILDNLLNSPPPAPPANVPPLDEAKGAAAKLSVREQMARHRADPTCASCHDRIDPLGNALETYDVIGRWRTEDNGAKIDETGPQTLKQLLLKRAPEFAQATLERLLTYALGRELDARDQPTVRQILRNTENTEYRFHDLILEIAKSVPFQKRQNQER